jgi:hypothetical protein
MTRNTQDMKDLAEDLLYKLRRVTNGANNHATGTMRTKLHAVLWFLDERPDEKEELKDKLSLHIDTAFNLLERIARRL